MKRAGFSVTELLVVMAVLSLLAALLFPSLRSARRASLDAKCIGNHRVIGAAFTRYVQDNNGFFYMKKDGWLDIIPYVKQGLTWATLYTTDNPLLCPRVAAIQPRHPSAPRLAPNYTIINGLYDTIDGVEVSPPPRWPVKLINVKEPSRMFIYTESGRVDANGSMMSESLSWVAPGSVEIGLKPGVSRLTWPHNQRQHVLFLDGHSESLSPAEFIKKPNSPEYFALWGLQP